MDRLVAVTASGTPMACGSTIGALSITEIPGYCLVSITVRRGRDADFETASVRHFGMALPEPGYWNSSGALALIRTGPDQWFAESPIGDDAGSEVRMRAALLDTASLTDQTDAWVRFDIEGGTVVDLLERVCPAPARRMRTGDLAQTPIEHCGCMLICRDTGTRFSVLGPRSFAGALYHALCAAARSIA